MSYPVRFASVVCVGFVLLTCFNVAFGAEEVVDLNEQTGRWRIRPIEGEVAYDWGDVTSSLAAAPTIRSATRSIETGLSMLFANCIAAVCD